MRSVILIAILSFYLFGSGVDAIKKSTQLQDYIKDSASSSVEEDSFKIAYKVGTLGLGFDLEYLINQTMAIRANINGFKYTLKDIEVEDNKYDFTATLQSSGILIDYHPWQNALRFSTGVYNHQSNIKGDIKVTSGELKIGDNVYPSMQIGSVDTTIDFNNINPYLGVGLSSVEKGGWRFVMDLGVLYIGEPKATLKATAAEGFEGLQHILDNESRIEEEKLNETLKKYKWYPVLSIGMQLRF